MSQHNIPETEQPAKEFESLTTIGLSKAQVHCYGLLSSVPSLRAGAMAKRLGINRPYLYPLLKDLCAKGFVERVQVIGAAHYKAVPLPLALVAYADYQREQVRELIVLQQELGERFTRPRRRHPHQP